MERVARTRVQSPATQARLPSQPCLPPRLLTCGLSGGDTPYSRPAICVRRSATVMNFFSRFLGITYV